MAYNSLSTANLPDPTIDPAQDSSPTDHFAPVIWTGNNTSGRSIPTGHQPDFVWTKERNSAINHIAQNSISGTGKYLHPNTNALEQSASTLITSFDTDGFTIGDSGSINGTSDTYVAWSWKANGAGSANSEGSITTTSTSANTTSGFSIIKWTGDGTIGHGLDEIPEMFIVKDLTATGSWWAWHKDLSNTSAGYLQLDSENSELSNTSVWRNSYPATLTTIDVNTSYLNYSTDNYLALCFHSVEGFSKFGSYTGGSDPFVYLGFEPAMIIFKRVTGTATHWAIRDNARKVDNPNRNTLYPSKPDVEYTGTAHDIDFLSNGFKIRNGDGLFDASATYIYAAWAKTPFKYGTGV